MYDSEEELQMKGVLGINLKIIFLFLNENIRFYPSLEPSQRDGSTEGSNISFYGGIWKITSKLFLSSLLFEALKCLPKCHYSFSHTF